MEDPKDQNVKKPEAAETAALASNTFIGEALELGLPLEIEPSFETYGINLSNTANDSEPSTLKMGYDTSAVSSRSKEELHALLIKTSRLLAETESEKTALLAKFSSEKNSLTAELKRRNRTDRVSVALATASAIAAILAIASIAFR